MVPGYSSTLNPGWEPLSPALFLQLPVLHHVGCRHICEDKARFYAHTAPPLSSVYACGSLGGNITSIPGCQNPPQQGPRMEKMRVRREERESASSAIRVSDVGGRRRRRAHPGGLGVRLPGETRGVHRIRHAHWHTHGWAAEMWGWTYNGQARGKHNLRETRGDHEKCCQTYSPS